MANPWFRVWGDMINDPKWRTIARKSEQKIGDVIAVYMHMLTCASNATERGRTEGWCDEDVATALDIDTEQVEAIREAMQGRVLDGDYLTGWEKRQPIKEDNSAERAKAWREAKKAEKEQQQTPPNETERQRTQDKDTDKKREEEKKSKPAQPSVALPDWVPADSWAGYLEMRKKKRKEPTAYALELVLADLTKFRDAGHDVKAILDASTKNGWTDVYAPKAEQQARASPSGGSGLSKAGQVTANNAMQWLEEQDAS